MKIFLLTNSLSLIYHPPGPPWGTPCAPPGPPCATHELPLGPLWALGSLGWTEHPRKPSSAPSMWEGRSGRHEQLVNSWGPAASSKKTRFFDCLIPPGHFCEKLIFQSPKSIFRVSFASKTNVPCEKFAHHTCSACHTQQGREWKR